MWGPVKNLKAFFMASGGPVKNLLVSPHGFRHWGDFNGKMDIQYMEFSGGVLFTVGHCVGCTPVGATLNVVCSGSVVPLAAPYVCPQCYATFTHR